MSHILNRKGNHWEHQTLKIVPKTTPKQILVGVEKFFPENYKVLENKFTPAVYLLQKGPLADQMTSYKVLRQQAGKFCYFTILLLNKICVPGPLKV